MAEPNDTSTDPNSPLPHEVDGRPLEDLNKAELFERAQLLKISGRHDMSKAQLLAALEEALTRPDGEPAPESEPAPEGLATEAQDALNESPPDEGDGPDTAKQPDGTKPPELTAEERAALADLVKQAETKNAAEAEQERQEAEARAIAAQRAAAERNADRAAAHAAGMLTQDDRVAILAASTEDLQSVADDAGAPAFVKAAVVDELMRRSVKEREDAARELMRTPLTQYRITGGPAGMRYVTKDAFMTTLPLGSIVSPTTHDLVHVQQQGFTWQEVSEVRLTVDQMGNKISEAR